ncbi:MAG TPA: hypothetical protein VHP38_09525 [Ruminiclostridium sp.]|nr:hypothetical protein [Ruminiclostridium sp.]
MGNAYERLFYIFKTMDSGWGNPGGFIKLEINGDNARLQLSLSNLEDKDGLVYSLVGISKSRDLRYTDISCITPVNSRADVKINFPADSIGSGRLNVHDINIFAVIARRPDKSAGTFWCPLAACTNGEQEWKEQFAAVLEKTSADAAETIKPEIDSAAEIPKSDVIPASSIVLEQEQADENMSFPVTENMQEPEIQVTQVEQSESPIESDTGIFSREISQEQWENQEGVEVGIQPWTILDETEQRRADESAQSSNIRSEQEQGVAQERNIEASEALEYTQKDFSTKDYIPPDMSSKFQDSLTSVYKNTYEEKDSESDEPGAPEDVWQRIQDDFNDISSININHPAKEPADEDSSAEERGHPFSIPLLKDELDKSFEPYNPFNTRSRGYKWWKINSPGFLNNILFRNNIKTYLLFNPKVMLAHYKYRYIILGIKTNWQPGREKLICGVPGVYSIDDNPFGSEGSWVQMEGYRPKYGAFGYWIVMLDPRTGKLTKIK